MRRLDGAGPRRPPGREHDRGVEGDGRNLDAECGNQDPRRDRDRYWPAVEEEIVMAITPPTTSAIRAARLPVTFGRDEREEPQRAEERVGVWNERASERREAEQAEPHLRLPEAETLAVAVADPS